jgi:hypothetical protein
VMLGAAALFLPAVRGIVSPSSDVRHCISATSSTSTSPRHSWLHHPVANCRRALEAEEATRGQAMRLRGGKNIPLDMKVFYWLQDRQGYFYVISCLLAAAWYMTPPLPEQMVMTEQRKLELQWASVVMVLAIMLFLAGPLIEGYLGAWSLGFAPFAHMMAIGAASYMWCAIGETVADARDAQLREETLDPNRPSIATNYRMMG